ALRALANRSHTLFTLLRWYLSWTSHPPMALLSVLLLTATLEGTSGAAVETTAALAVENAAALQEPAPQQSEPGDSRRAPTDADAKKPPTPPHTGVRALLAGVGEDFKHLPTVSNGSVAAIGGAAA